MNHFKLMVGLLIASVVLISCQKEVLTPSLTQETHADSEKLSLEIRNGIPGFSSAEHFFSVVDQLATLDQEALNHWELAQGFTSYRSIVQAALAEINAAKSAQEAELLARKHHLILEKNEWGYQPKLDIAYASISNVSGQFYIGTTLNTVQGNYLLAVEEGDLEQLEQALENPENFQAEGVSVTKIPAAKFSRTCGNFTHAVSQNTSYRTVIALASKTMPVNQLGMVFARSKVDLGVQADVHQGGDYWMLDNTEVFTESVNVTVETVDGTHVSVAINDIYSHDGKAFSRTWVGTPIMYPTGTLIVPATTMISAIGKGYSKRLGINYKAEINCQ